MPQRPATIMIALHHYAVSTGLDALHNTKQTTVDELARFDLNQMHRACILKNKVERKICFSSTPSFQRRAAILAKAGTSLMAAAAAGIAAAGRRQCRQCARRTVAAVAAPG